MRSFSSHDPFNGTNTAGTLLFVGAVEQVRAAGFSITELDYLLRHKAAPTLALAPTDKEIGDWLADLRGGLRRIADESLHGCDQRSRWRVDTGEAIAVELGT